MSEEATSTVVRVVRLLQCIAEVGGEISVKEFAAHLSLPPSTVHRLLKLLMSQGLIEQRATTQRYRVGRELFRISSLIARQVDFEEIARPILTALRDACQETCYFAMYLPTSRRFVGTVVARSPHPLGYHFEPLMQQKVAWGAVGRCMLAYLPEEEVRKAVAEAGESPAGNPPPSLKDMKAALEEIRERGYASAEGEIFPEAIGFARVVFDADGNVMGSLGITMPMIRYKASMHKQLANLVIGKAKELSKALGYREVAELPASNELRPRRRARA
ncbi:IclR family transcriptional regulator [Pseudorhodoplanes sinuspersici]|uniref:IclR family transcriptional regulator n=1 Tax=Pseudorhodoplanes sinuspersici TaxID=1235591 RepID=UPI000FEF0FAE|nr:IclR family transcriptional regulator [Pseudorhodoplanes sinuspersici]RKE70605.1 IclR family transcriptional regulator [Pseudorhodoplanes sinuspersici]